MPSLRVHCAVSKDRTGFNFEELHKWIDAPAKDLGVNHRVERHADNSSDRAKIKEFWDREKGEGWGDKAIIEWLFHISIDNLETAFKQANKTYRKDNVYNLFRFGFIPHSKFIFFDFENLNEEEMEEEFEESYEADED